MTEVIHHTAEAIQPKDMLVALGDTALNRGTLYTMYDPLSGLAEHDLARELTLVPAHLEDGPIEIGPGKSANIRTNLALWLEKPDNENHTVCAIVRNVPFSPLMARAVVIDRGFDSRGGFTLHLENTSDGALTIDEGDMFAALEHTEVFDPAKFTITDSDDMPDLRHEHDRVAVALFPDAADRGLDLERIANPDSNLRHEGDAGLDLQCDGDFTIEPGEVEFIPTGIKLAATPDIVPTVQPRTGMGRRGLMPSQISRRADGELIIHVTNRGEETISLKTGDRFAQVLAVIKNPQSPAIQGVEHIIDIPDPDSNRGKSAYGSTDK